MNTENLEAEIKNEQKGLSWKTKAFYFGMFIGASIGATAFFLD